MTIAEILNNLLTRQPLSAEQAAWLQVWAEHPENRVQLENLLHAQQEPADARHIYEDVMRRVAAAEKRRRVQRAAWWSAAAAVVLMVGGLWMLERGGEPQTTPQTAVLVLDDGREIALKGDTVVTVNGVEVEVQDGRVRYAAAAQRLALRVPRGVEPMSVVLDDGSMVRLNSDSQLNYPARFEGGTRDVELSGEAFFEVSKDADHPFVVHSGAMITTVLGTTFNVSAYKDDPAVETTLVEGSVRVQTDGGASQVLAPSMQASLSQQGGLMIRNVNADAATAWREGVMNLDETDLQQIMRTLARWYDIEVEYVGDAAQEHNFSGRLRRADGLNRTLETLTMTGAPRFTVDGRKVTVH